MGVCYCKSIFCISCIRYCVPCCGPVKFNSLIKRFGDIDSAVLSLGPDVAFCDSVKREMDKAAQLGIHYLSDDDVLYPANLRKIKNHQLKKILMKMKNVTRLIFLNYDRVFSIYCSTEAKL